ncbi:MAG: hypothetical protein ACXWBN_15740, partial [Acidimicrobiales bacterium]
LAAGFAVATALEHGLSVRAGAIAAAVMVVGLAIAVVGAGLGHGIGKVGPPLSFLVMGAIVTLLVVGERRPDRRTLFGGLLVAALALELVAYQNHVRLARIEVEDHLPGYVRFVRDNVGDGRVLSAGRNALYPEWGSVLGIRDISTINVDQLPRYRDFFLAYVNPEEPWLFLQIGRDPEIHFRADPSALDLLSVRYLIVDQDMGTYDREVAARYPRVFIDDQAHIDVYANPEAFPRAYLSPALSDGPPPEPGSGAWSMTAPSTSDAGLLAEAAQDGVPRDAPAETAAPGTARITADHADRVEISVDATQPSVLVLSDSDQSDWSATIDGHPAHLGRVDQILRGVIVPAGASTVVFRYHSHARDVGAVLSITAVLGLVIATGVWSRCRRRSEGGAVSAPST